MVYSSLGGEPGVGQDVEHMETVALGTSRDQEGATGGRRGGSFEVM